MKKLNLPPFDYKIKRESDGDRIFDIVRKKYLVLTPEEWVRQHLVHYMIETLGYPKSLIKVESGLKYNYLRKRSDIVVYNTSGEPFLLAECKSASNKITKEAMFQAITYNRVVRAKYIAITNGMGFICAEVDQDGDDLNWIDELPDFPK